MLRSNLKVSSETNGHESGPFFCRTCTFADVLPLWKSELWPGRTSPIETNSAMKWLGGIDMTLMSATTTFWSVRNKSDNRIIGVLSGHFGGVIEGKPGVARAYRTRGLWVADDMRRIGVAKLLMEAAFKQARAEKCPYVWTFPRESSIIFYESMKFVRAGDWIGVDNPLAGEFGPNCYALAQL